MAYLNTIAKEGLEPNPAGGRDQSIDNWEEKSVFSLRNYLFTSENSTELAQRLGQTAPFTACFP